MSDKKMRPHFHSFASFGSLKSRLSGITSAASHAENKDSKRRNERLVIAKRHRLYLNYMNSPIIYPLPVDLTETHRQILIDHMVSAVFETPVLSAHVLRNPPRRVLEVGCNSGYWSSVCHKYFGSKGYSVSYTGIDIRPDPGVTESYRAMGMDWEYIQFDLREPEWPVAENSFDLVLARNLALAFTSEQYAGLARNYVRALRPGGTLELTEQDYTLRSVQACLPDSGTHDELDLIARGVYPVDGSASVLGPAINPFVINYNNWVTEALGELKLASVPTALVGPFTRGDFFEEYSVMAVEDLVCKRIAIPLGSLQWECQGDGPRDHQAAAALRKIAFDTFISMVDALEPLLFEISREEGYDWGEWLEQAKANWTKEGGLGHGECLEFGTWSLRKQE